MFAQLERHRFTVTDYHRLLETGVLNEDSRVELLDGEIIKMAPIGPRHAACVDKLNAFLQRKVSRMAIVRVQNPILLNEYSEPEPDLSLLKQRSDYYKQGHPTPDDILVAIEVADTTVDSDRAFKIPSYARAGIPEVWLIDLYNDRVEVYTRPASGLYQEVRIILRGHRFASSTLPQLKLKADSLLV
jgi:Uma2 family endonuclease